MQTSEHVHTAQELRAAVRVEHPADVSAAAVRVRDIAFEVELCWHQRDLQQVQARTGLPLPDYGEEVVGLAAFDF